MGKHTLCRFCASVTEPNFWSATANRTSSPNCTAFARPSRSAHTHTHTRNRAVGEICVFVVSVGTAAG